jgi:hypothetical protein
MQSVAKDFVLDKKKGNFWGFLKSTLFNNMLHLPHFRFHYVGGCWDLTQHCYDFGIGCQTL